MIEHTRMKYVAAMMIAAVLTILCDACVHNLSLLLARLLE
jgi:hypothetical protein